ncbi:hypothetical protein F4808DRAFT_191451 [Astrocystis sublimbata]|nr:hypothetical protein F4808DRAFT_191451 [Astrocystis sublimbata]
MAATSAGQMGVVPAQLGFLAIFNPSLGATDETLDDQIVYYASITTQSQKRRHRSHGKHTADLSREERNERLRQIGLAQGMVEFSRGFAQGEPIDTIETEQTRVVLQEVEPGWWILASIDLTRIPLPPRIGSPAPGEADGQADNVEYSSRELKPSTLLMRDLIRAHSVFLLHHSSSLSALYVRSRRSNFVKILSRYWDLYLSTWDVMLHGNPASNVFRGIKIAACGELGVGVGEENRGSGEREVLEGFVGRIEGLTDLVVSKFGTSESASDRETADNGKASALPVPWVGTGADPGGEDGAIFLGVGALSRKSLCDITYWMEDIYTWGESAYGVKESPSSTRQTRRRRKSITGGADGNESLPKSSDEPASSARNSSARGTAALDSKASESTKPGKPTQDEGTPEEGMTKFMSYLKMGYGTHWSLGSSEDGTRSSHSAKSDAQPGKVSAPTTHRSPGAGQFVIGLLGDIEENVAKEHEEEAQADNESGTSEYNSRILLRILTVELDGDDGGEGQQMEDLGSQSTELSLTKSGNKDLMNPHSRFDSQDRNKTQKMRVVVYINRPFMFTFLFRNMTDSLAWESLYRSLHNQLAPLWKPLTLSTAYQPVKPDVGEKSSHIFDLIWDPKALTVQSTIPSIPTPMEMLREDAAPVWSRAEAISTHSQILNMYKGTLDEWSELERTCKTNRGWWVVWTRIPEREATEPDGENTPENNSHRPSDTVVPTLRQSDSLDTQNNQPRLKVDKEIFLIRRAGEHTGLRGIGSGSYAENSSGGWAEGASRLAQGIGVDTHKYIEDLLTLGR